MNYTSFINNFLTFRKTSKNTLHMNIDEILPIMKSHKYISEYKIYINIIDKINTNLMELYTDYNYYTITDSTLYNLSENKPSVIFLGYQKHVTTYIVYPDNKNIFCFDPRFIKDKTDNIEQLYKNIPKLKDYNIIFAIEYNLQYISEQDNYMDIFCYAWCYYFLL